MKGKFIATCKSIQPLKSFAPEPSPGPQPPETPLEALLQILISHWQFWICPCFHSFWTQTSPNISTAHDRTDLTHTHCRFPYTCPDIHSFNREVDGCSVSSSYSISTCRRLRRLRSTSTCSSSSTSDSASDTSCLTSYNKQQWVSMSSNVCRVSRSQRQSSKRLDLIAAFSRTVKLILVLESIGEVLEFVADGFGIYEMKTARILMNIRLLQSLQPSTKQHIGQVFFINNLFSSTSKLLTPNMYFWSSKILVTTYWTHLRVNGICAKSFCLQKMNNRTLFFMGCFQQ